MQLRNYTLEVETKIKVKFEDGRGLGEGGIMANERSLSNLFINLFN